MSSSTESLTRSQVNCQASEAACSLLAALQQGASLEPGVLQAVFASVAREYVDQLKNGVGHPRPNQDAELTATEAMILSTEVLRAADLQLFELGMWQALGGPN